MFLNVIIAIKIFLHRKKSNVISDTLNLLRKYFSRFYNTPSTFIEMRQKYFFSDKYIVLIINFNMRQFIKTFFEEKK